MDYAGWELERQRRVLAALLLGGEGGREDGVRDAGRRSPETAWEQAGAAGQTAAGTYGRYAAGPGSPEGWNALREVPGASRSQDEGPETPPSAWEGVLGAEASTGWDRTADAPAGTGTGREETPGAFGRETEARAAARKPSGRRRGRGLKEDAAGGEWMPDSRMPGLSAGEKRDGDGETLVRRDSGTAADGDETARRGGGFPAAGGGWVSVSRGNPAAGGSLARETALVWNGEGEAELQAEERAKALSRTVQRDARRYDGGFAIY